VPEPRDRLELQKFATQRLGKDVLDMEHVDLVRGERTLLSDATWRLGPGDRVGIVGVNGAGKTSVLSLLAHTLSPQSGRVKHGRTVALQHLTQAIDVVDPEARVLATVEDIRRVTRLSDGSDVSATARSPCSPTASTSTSPTAAERSQMYPLSPPTGRSWLAKVRRPVRQRRSPGARRNGQHARPWRAWTSSSPGSPYARRS